MSSSDHPTELLEDVDHKVLDTGMTGARQRLVPGEGVTVTENDRPVARLISCPSSGKALPWPRPPVTGVPRAGQDEGRLVVPDDFKEPLEEMRQSLV